MILGVPLATFAVVEAATASIAHDRGVIIFAGDSNFIFGAEDINLALTTWAPHEYNSYVPVMLARYGTGIRNADCPITVSCTTYNYWQTKLGETFAKVKADAVVTDLGINDAGFPGTATTPGYASYGQKIDWFMKLVPEHTRVFWINSPCLIEPPARLTGCAEINTSLALATRRWSNLTLINWSTAANYHPEYIQTRQVHYTEAGYHALSLLISKALDTHFAVPAG